ncbi:MAG: family 1 glycosylhydrolase [Acidimicrobiales bacterium]
MSTPPEAFWWGTAASSTQCEGAAPASDWKAWENADHAPASGDGNGFATQYATDFTLMAGHGLTHHRLSIEWARIEPDEGRRNPQAIEHYIEVLTAARAAGVHPWVCLHHFTLPGWFSADEHGFPDARARNYFWPRHVDFMAETFGDLVFGWKPVNEPTAYAVLGWWDGTGPPGLSGNPGRFAEALEAIHLAAFDAALRLRQTGRPVATIHNLSPVVPVGDDPAARDWARLTDEVLWCWAGAVRDGVMAVPGRAAIERPELRDAFDLVGFSYYNALGVGPDGSFHPYPGDARVGPLGYAPWSEGLGLVIQRLAEEVPDKGLLVGEHGIGTTDDGWRTSFLRDSLGFVEQAVADGIDLRGFFHWTAIDNYEWRHGFDVPFGLFDRDREAKPSIEALGIQPQRLSG